MRDWTDIGPEALPRALAAVHSATSVGESVRAAVAATWERTALDRLVTGGGFALRSVEEGAADLRLRAERCRTLPDTVGPRMRLLVCGLNPSLHAADAGVGYAGPGNRFWPAAVEAGVVSRPRDPWSALDEGVGMTDLAKRATPRAAALRPGELREGSIRVEHLVRRLRPAAVCFVGLSGYRTAVDRRAAPGWQEQRFGGAPAYVMPSTSGINTHTRFDDLVEHLRAVQGPPRRGTSPAPLG